MYYTVLYSIVGRSQVFDVPLQEVWDVLKQSLHTLQSFSLCFIMEAKRFNRFCCGEIHNLFEECRSQFNGDSEMEERFDHDDSDVHRVDDIAICEVILVKMTLKQKKISRKFLLGRHEQLCWTKGNFLQCFEVQM